MNKFFIFIIVAIFSLFVPSSVLAADYYVSTTGNDTNNGTSPTTAFKTFAKAVNTLTAGSRLNIMGGTYTERLVVAKSGTSVSPIYINSYQNQTVVIDGTNSKANLIDISGYFVQISGIEVKNSSGYCVSITGNNNQVSNLLVHDCRDMGIYTDGKNNSILNNTVHHASTVNSDFHMASGYGSGIKVRIGGENILIANNISYNNYGEGIAVTRGVNVTVKNNTVYDNYVVNIYVDNSRGVVVENNFSYCHPNNGFLRNGYVAAGFSIGEEFYSGWGAQLSNIKIKNNISAFCSRGVIFFGNESGSTEVVANILPSIIANNTFWGNTNTAISIASHSGAGDIFQKNLLIANNIVQSPVNKLIYFDVPTGIIVNNNFWVGTTLPATTYRGTSYLSGDPKLIRAADYDPSSYNIQSTSAAIDKGRVISNVTNDYVNSIRPIGSGYDIGAYEYGGTSVLPTLAASPLPTVAPTPFVKSGDANNDNLVNDADYSVWLSNYGKSISGASNGDFNNNSKVDGVDYVIWKNNYLK